MRSGRIRQHIIAKLISWTLFGSILVFPKSLLAQIIPEELRNYLLLAPEIVEPQQLDEFLVWFQNLKRGHLSTFRNTSFEYNQNLTSYWSSQRLVPRTGSGLDALNCSHHRTKHLLRKVYGQRLNEVLDDIEQLETQILAFDEPDENASRAGLEEDIERVVFELFAHSKALRHISQELSQLNVDLPSFPSDDVVVEHRWRVPKTDLVRSSRTTAHFVFSDIRPLRFFFPGYYWSSAESWHHFSDHPAVLKGPSYEQGSFVLTTLLTPEQVCLQDLYSRLEVSLHMDFDQQDPSNQSWTRHSRDQVIALNGVSIEGVSRVWSDKRDLLSWSNALIVRTNEARRSFISNPSAGLRRTLQFIADTQATLDTCDSESSEDNSLESTCLIMRARAHNLVAWPSGLESWVMNMYSTRLVKMEPREAQQRRAWMESYIANKNYYLAAALFDLH